MSWKNTPEITINTKKAAPQIVKNPLSAAMTGRFIANDKGNWF